MLGWSLTFAILALLAAFLGFGALAGFAASVAKLLFHGAQVDSFAFDIEVLTRASRLGLETAEVPVRWT